MFLDTEYIDMALSLAPDATEKLWWGKRTYGVVVHLQLIEFDLVMHLLQQAIKLKSS